MIYFGWGWPSGGFRYVQPLLGMALFPHGGASFRPLPSPGPNRGELDSLTSSIHAQRLYFWRRDSRVVIALRGDEWGLPISTRTFPVTFLESLSDLLQA